MAKPYEHFDDDQNGVTTSASNISFIQPIHDEGKQSGVDTLVNDNAKHCYKKDSNNAFENAHKKNKKLFVRVKEKNDFLNERTLGKSGQSLVNALHWEKEGQNIEAGLIESQTVNDTASDVPLLPVSHTPQTQSQNNGTLGVKVVSQHQSEEENDYNYISDTASSFIGNSALSNDESEIEEPFVRNGKFRLLQVRSVPSKRSSRNLNFNNNKKKKIDEERNNPSSTKDSLSPDMARDSDDSFALQRERFAKGRFRSVQLSSIRALSATRKRGKSMEINVAYGQRLVEKNGSSNVQIVVR